jgi:hypothetical protein
MWRSGQVNNDIIIRPTTIDNDNIYDFLNQSTVKELKQAALSKLKQPTDDAMKNIDYDSYQVIITFIDKESKTIIIEYDNDIFVAQKEYILNGCFVKVMADIYTTNINPRKKSILLPTKNHNSLYASTIHDSWCVETHPKHRGRKPYRKHLFGNVDKVRQLFCNIPFSLTAKIDLFQNSSNLEGQKAFKTLKTIGMTQEYQLVKRIGFNIGQPDTNTFQNQHIQVNIMNQNGWTALHYACYFGCKESVMSLLQNPDMNVNAKDEIGETLLHKLGNLDLPLYVKFQTVMEVLLENPNIRFHETNIHGETVIDKLSQVKDTLESLSFKLHNMDDHEYDNIGLPYTNEDHLTAVVAKRTDCQQMINLVEKKLMNERNHALSFLRLMNWGNTVKECVRKRTNEVLNL